MSLLDKRKSLKERPENMIVCPNCHANNHEGAEFCDECGYRFVQETPIEDISDSLEELKEESLSPEVETVSFDNISLEEVELPEFEDEQVEEPDELLDEFDIPATDEFSSPAASAPIEPVVIMTEEEMEAKKREEEERIIREKEEAERKAREEAEEAERKAREEAERIAREQEELERKKLEAERIAREEAERQRQEEERKRQEELAKMDQCPNCGALNEKGSIFCKGCGIRLVSPMYSVPRTDEDVSITQINAEDAIPGDRFVVYKNGDKYVAIMAPLVPVEVIDADENQAAAVQADYMLTFYDMPLKDKAWAVRTLDGNRDYVETLYHSKDVDAIYGVDTNRYKGMKSITDEFFSLNLPEDVVEQLSTLTPKEQQNVITAMSKTKTTSFSVASARKIALSDKSEESIQNILLQEVTIREIIHELLGNAQ